MINELLIPKLCDSGTFPWPSTLNIKSTPGTYSSKYLWEFSWLLSNSRGEHLLCDPGHPSLWPNIRNTSPAMWKCFNESTPPWNCNRLCTTSPRVFPRHVRCDQRSQICEWRTKDQNNSQLWVVWWRWWEITQLSSDSWDFWRNWEIVKLTKTKKQVIAPENGWDWKTIWFPFWDADYFQDFSDAILVLERVFTCSFVTRWVPSSKKWSYNPNK